jgi:hypothetical protein
MALARASIGSSGPKKDRIFTLSGLFSDTLSENNDKKQRGQVLKKQRGQVLHDT